MKSPLSTLTVESHLKGIHYRAKIVQNDKESWCYWLLVNGLLVGSPDHGFSFPGHNTRAKALQACEEMARLIITERLGQQAKAKVTQKRNRRSSPSLRPLAQLAHAGALA